MPHPSTPHDNARMQRTIARLNQHVTNLESRVKAREQVVDDLLKALDYIEGLALANESRDLPTIAATARKSSLKARGQA